MVLRVKNTVRGRFLELKKFKLFGVYLRIRVHFKLQDFTFTDEFFNGVREPL